MTETPPPLSVAPKIANQAKKISPLKFVLGVLTFIVVIAGSMSLGLYLRGGPPEAGAPNPIGSAIMFVLGLFVLFIGLALYGLTLATGCFTLDFTRPFCKAFGKKLWFANLLIGLLLPGGIAFMTMPMLYPALLRVLPPQVALMASIFAPFIATQFFMVWFVLWAPLIPIVVRRRMRGRGLPDAQVATGRIVGTSDPSRSSMRRLGMIESDLGVLWIDDARLVFWGDENAWEIPHASLLEIERKADAGAVSAYFGAVHVILRFTDVGGGEQRIRLHAEGAWTQTGSARSLNAIADRLNAWIEQPRAGWVDHPSGFSVEAR